MVNEGCLNSRLDAFSSSDSSVSDEPLSYSTVSVLSILPHTKLHCLALSLYGISQKNWDHERILYLEARGREWGSVQLSKKTWPKRKKQNWGIGCTHEVHFTTLFYSWACEEYYHVVVLGTSPVILRHKNLLECRMNSVHGFGYVTIWCRLWYGLVLRSWGSSHKGSQDSSDCCCSNHRCHRQLGLFQISEPQI